MTILSSILSAIRVPAEGRIASMLAVFWVPLLVGVEPVEVACNAGAMATACVCVKGADDCGQSALTKRNLLIDDLP